MSGDLLVSVADESPASGLVYVVEMAHIICPFSYEHIFLLT